MVTNLHCIKYVISTMYKGVIIEGVSFIFYDRKNLGLVDFYECLDMFVRYISTYHIRDSSISKLISVPVMLISPKLLRDFLLRVQPSARISLFNCGSCSASRSHTQPLGQGEIGDVTGRGDWRHSCGPPPVRPIGYRGWFRNNLVIESTLCISVSLISPHSI